MHYLASSTLIGIRSWTRRDRRMQGRWPTDPTLPPHWLAGASTEEPRISFAVDAMYASVLIGRVTLRLRDKLSAHLGIILHPEWCGKGYGTAALLVIQQLQAQSGLQLLTLDVANDNERAKRAYARLGWEVTGETTRSGHRYILMQVRL